MFAAASSGQTSPQTPPAQTSLATTSPAGVPKGSSSAANCPGDPAKAKQGQKQASQAAEDAPNQSVLQVAGVAQLIAPLAGAMIAPMPPQPLAGACVPDQTEATDAHTPPEDLKPNDALLLAMAPMIPNTPSGAPDAAMAGPSSAAVPRGSQANSPSETAGGQISQAPMPAAEQDFSSSNPAIGSPSAADALPEHRVARTATTADEPSLENRVHGLLVTVESALSPLADRQAAPLAAVASGVASHMTVVARLSAPPLSATASGWPEAGKPAAPETLAPVSALSPAKAAAAQPILDNSSSSGSQGQTPERTEAEDTHAKSGVASGQAEVLFKVPAPEEKQEPEPSTQSLVSPSEAALRTVNVPASPAQATTVENAHTSAAGESSSPDLSVWNPGKLTPPLPADSASHGELRVALQTERLGSVELRARISGDDLGAAITVERKDAHAVLATELPALERSLAEKQFHVQQLSLLHATTGFHAGSDPGTSGERTPTPQRHPSSHWDSTSPANRPVEQLSLVPATSGIFDASGRLSVRA